MGKRKINTEHKVKAQEGNCTSLAYLKGEMEYIPREDRKKRK